MYRNDRQQATEAHALLFYGMVGAAQSHYNPAIREAVPQEELNLIERDPQKLQATLDLLIDVVAHNDPLSFLSRYLQSENSGVYRQPLKFFPRRGIDTLIGHLAQYQRSAGKAVPQVAKYILEGFYHERDGIVFTDEDGVFLEELPEEERDKIKIPGMNMRIGRPYISSFTSSRKNPVRIFSESDLGALLSAAYVFTKPEFARTVEEYSTPETRQWVVNCIGDYVKNRMEFKRTLSDESSYRFETEFAPVIKLLGSVNVVAVAQLYVELGASPETALYAVSMSAAATGHSQDAADAIAFTSATYAQLFSQMFQDNEEIRERILDMIPDRLARITPVFGDDANSHRVDQVRYEHECLPSSRKIHVLQEGRTNTFGINEPRRYTELSHEEVYAKMVVNAAQALRAEQTLRLVRSYVSVPEEQLGELELTLHTVAALGAQFELSGDISEAIGNTLACAIRYRDTTVFGDVMENIAAKSIYDKHETTRAFTQFLLRDDVVQALTANYSPADADRIMQENASIAMDYEMFGRDDLDDFGFDEHSDLGGYDDFDSLDQLEKITRREIQKQHDKPIEVVSIALENVARSFEIDNQERMVEYLTSTLRGGN